MCTIYIVSISGVECTFIVGLDVYTRWFVGCTCIAFNKMIP